MVLWAYKAGSRIVNNGNISRMFWRLTNADAEVTFCLRKVGLPSCISLVRTKTGQPKVRKSGCLRGGNSSVNSLCEHFVWPRWGVILWIFFALEREKVQNSGVIMVDHMHMACRSMVRAFPEMIPMYRSTEPFCQCAPTPQRVCFCRWPAQF